MTDDRAELIERLAEQSAEIAALRDSEATYHRLFDTIDDGFCIAEQVAHDPPDFRYLTANPAFHRQTGLGDPTGRTMRELVPEIEDDTIARYARVAAGAASESFVARGLDRQFHVEVLPAGQAGRIAVLFRDITASERAKAILRESEDRQAFLLKLSDALRAIGNPVEIQRAANRMLGEHLEASRVFYVVIDQDGDTADISGDYVNGVPSLTGRYSLSAFSSYAVREWHAGRTASSNDVNSDARYSAAERAAYASVSTRAGFGIPLIKEGKLVALFGVNQSSPRQWTERDIGLASETAERTWAAVERARSEAALRESEELRRVALQSGGMGTWKWDTRNRTVRSDSPYQNVWGFVPAGQPHSVSVYANLMNAKGEALLETVMAKESVPDEVFEDQVQLTSGPNAGRWIQWRGRAGRIEPWIINGVSFDITEQKLGEQRLRESEERQAFLLKLGDTLRAETGAEAVGNRAAALIAEELNVDRVYLVTVDGDDVTVTHEVRRADMPPLKGSYRGSDFPTAMNQIFERTIVYEDVRRQPEFTDLDRRSFEALGAVGFMAVPIRRGDQTMIWAAGAVSTTPRAWTANEVLLFEGAIERTWAAVARARAEAALRESEERFQQFAASSSDAFWIRDAQTFAFRFCSSAVTSIFGVTPAEVIAEPRLINALLVPEDREAASRRVERIARGEQITHEYRIQRSTDQAFRWIRSTGFALRNERGSIGHIAAIVSDITETKLAVEHQGVLMAELQHRVRNIMAIVRSIASRTADSAADVVQYADLLDGRYLALSRVQALLTRSANRSVSLRTMIADELGGQAAHEAQYEVEGPDVEVSPKVAEILTLALHELTTNALKYGALSVTSGKIIVRWALVDRRATPWIVLDWMELGGPSPQGATNDRPRRRGFGRELIEDRIPYELNGRGTLTFTPDGARCQLEFPLVSATSVLETGAPQRALVFGGLSDMTHEAQLVGRCVLVVEDDYYLATDVSRVLRSAGAQVLGPCANEADARAALERQKPDAVLVDINLGDGPTFALAGTLKDIGIPFAFVTGYDQTIIPAQFDGVERLEKPAQPKHVIGAVARMLTTDACSA